MNWVFLLISTSLSCHSALKACLELQNLHLIKQKKTSSWVKVLAWSIESLGKVLLPGPQPTYATVPSLPEDEGNLMDDGFCDFAFGSAQNDRVGGYTAKSESPRN